MAVFDMNVLLLCTAYLSYLPSITEPKYYLEYNGVTSFGTRCPTHQTFGEISRTEVHSHSINHYALSLRDLQVTQVHATTSTQRFHRDQIRTLLYAILYTKTQPIPPSKTAYYDR